MTNANDIATDTLLQDLLRRVQQYLPEGLRIQMQETTLESDTTNKRYSLEFAYRLSDTTGEPILPISREWLDADEMKEALEMILHLMSGIEEHGSRLVQERDNNNNNSSNPSAADLTPQQKAMKEHLLKLLAANDNNND